MRRLLALLSVTSLFFPALTRAATIAPGDLIKASQAAVYYYGADYQRYVFPTEGTFKTWYSDFSTVKTISDQELGTIRIGGNVTYRPGVRLLKVTTDPKTYAVDQNGTLKWITTEETARALYGADWNQKVDDLPDPFFINYRVGMSITSSSQFNPAAVTANALTINDDKNLHPIPLLPPTPTPSPTPTPTSTTPGHVGYLWVSNQTPRLLERVDIRAWDPGNSIQLIRIFFDGQQMTTCTTFMCIYTVTIPTNNVKNAYDVRAEFTWSDGSSYAATTTLTRMEGFAGRDWYNRTPEVRPGMQRQYGVTVTTTDIPFEIDLYLDGVLVKQCLGQSACDQVDYEANAIGTTHTLFARIRETNQSTSYDTALSTIAVVSNPRPMLTIATGKMFLYRGETLDVTVNATDDGSIARTEVWLDGNLLRACSAPTCTAIAGPWNAARGLTFVGRAVDNQGAERSATSSAVFVQ